MYYITKYNTVMAHYDGIDENKEVIGTIEDTIWELYSAYPDCYKIQDGKFIPLKTEAEMQAKKLNDCYIPDAERSAMALMRTLLKTARVGDTDTKLAVSGLYEKWTAGKYEIGDIRNHAGQTWECLQAHDNAEYPDIVPENPQTWANFWKPLHGKSAANARPWTKPQFGTTDMYLTGEYMVYTDGETYKCLSDTVYSPEEYAQHWEIQN